MIKRITASLMNLEREHTAHAQGIKQVFLRSGDTPTTITQVAYGQFSRSDYCEWHSHPTMEECFFFLKGSGIYWIADTEVPLQHGVFVRIPAGVSHRLEATDDQPLEYVYFGVATNN